MNRNGKVNVRDAAVVAWASGSYSAHTRSNPVADMNNDNRIDMKDNKPTRQAYWITQLECTY